MHSEGTVVGLSVSLFFCLSVCLSVFSVPKLSISLFSGTVIFMSSPTISDAQIRHPYVESTDSLIFFLYTYLIDFACFLFLFFLLNVGPAVQGFNCTLPISIYIYSLTFQKYPEYTDCFPYIMIVSMQ